MHAENITGLTALHYNITFCRVTRCIRHDHLRSVDDFVVTLVPFIGGVRIFMKGLFMFWWIGRELPLIFAFLWRKTKQCKNINVIGNIKHFVPM